MSALDADAAALREPRLPQPLIAAASAAPAAIVLIASSLALAAGVAVSLDAHHPWTVMPLAALIAALGWRPLVRVDPHPRAALAGTLLVVGLVAWTVANALMASEYLIVVRDPGFLTLSGIWLVDHGGTDIPASGAIEAAALQANLIPDASEAWTLRGEMVQPQGAHMLPATIAIGGWIGGLNGVLVANVVAGAAGLAAVHLAARRFLTPMAALAPATALALTVAHIGLSRAAYTEPLTLLLVIAGLAWTWQGVDERRWAPVLAGAIATGATSLIRIDAAAFAVGALAGAALALAASPHDATWRRRALLGFAGMQLLVLGAGYLALLRWSREYVLRLTDQITSLGAVYVLGLVVAVAWALTWGRRLRGERLLTGATARLGHRGSLIGALVVSGALVALASRPLWTVVRRGTETPSDVFANGVVEQFQAAAGMEIDPLRTYAEHTITWISYYLTWPLVALGVLGFGLMTYRALRGQGAWWIALAALLAPTLMYAWQPSIMPDQLWAIRRFEPASLPGFLLAAAVAAWWLASLLRTEGARHSARRVAAIAFVMLPLSTWVSVVPGDEDPVLAAVNVATREMGAPLGGGEHDGAVAQAQALCDVADGRPIILAGTSSHFGTLRVMCDVPVVLALVEPTQETLAAMTEVFGEPPVVLTRNAEWVAWTSEPQVVVSSTVVHSDYSLQRIPRTLIMRSYEWYAGVVTPTGEVQPIAREKAAASALNP
ncbi:hypothetical protein [Demequina sp. NBRC 110052]|uniref:hypothetical protein n=1 Tax=Demequina sp. NBRC 110052 TaxID=1570341 RepID=UPI000A073ADC|nr:hypothetical protein [Demequina sp. NBRC 110052]